MEYARKEYPRPQFRRDEWQSLNGEWEFEFDDAGDGVKRGLPTGKVKLRTKIVVPFSYQWEASGIGDRAQHDVVWYRRTFCTSQAGKRTLLCFNAADYETDVWINGRHATSHEGGFTPFQADITDLTEEGENVIVVRCVDRLDPTRPRGKQSRKGVPFSCFYYPNSGIWQSVWLEYFGEDGIGAYALQSDIDTRTICGYVQTLYGLADALEIELTFRGKGIKKQRFTMEGCRTEYGIKLTEAEFAFGDMLWSPETPNLIDADFTLYKGGKVCDRAHTRIGMRKITVTRERTICLNGRPLFQRLVLDQGYWRESGLTPPCAEALKKDIELSMAMGFNGARKHQKFEDPYYYYYAEEMGFLTWCEMPSAYEFCEKEVQNITQEWQEIVACAKNFTSVVAYVPLNESWGVREIRTDRAQQDFARSLYYLTKSLDPARLISTNDGFETLEESDLLGIHDYDIRCAEEFPVKYGGGYDGLNPQGWALFANGNAYRGQPVLFTEFGGIAFASEQRGEAWGYGNGAKDASDLCERLNELICGIAQVPFQGYCYTQLTDVEQEINGLLYADRTPKCDLQTLKQIFEHKQQSNDTKELL